MTDFQGLNLDFTKEWMGGSTGSPFLDLSSISNLETTVNPMGAAMPMASASASAAISQQPRFDLGLGGMQEKGDGTLGEAPLLTSSQPQFDRGAASKLGRSTPLLTPDLNFGGTPMFYPAGGFSGPRLKEGVFAADGGFGTGPSDPRRGPNGSDSGGSSGGGDRADGRMEGSAPIAAMAATAHGRRTGLSGMPAEPNAEIAPDDDEGAEGSVCSSADVGGAFESGSGGSSESSRRRKRPLSKREPLAEEFSEDEEYARVWAKWREDRDHNNKSVKRSRERAKVRKVQAEQAVKKRKGGSSRNISRPIPETPASATSAADPLPATSQTEVELRLEHAMLDIELLVKMIRQPTRMTSTEKRDADDILAAHGSSTTVTASGRKSTFKRKR